jgi:hypothetical protein
VARRSDGGGFEIRFDRALPSLDAHARGRGNPRVGHGGRAAFFQIGSAESSAALQRGQRRFGQWDAALQAAGVDPQDVRQRRAAPDLRAHRRRRNAQGELSFEHTEREDTRKRRRQPKKSVAPVPPKPDAPVVAAPLKPLPMRRAAPKGRPRKPAPRSEIVALEKETDKRTKILARAAKNKACVPKKAATRGDASCSNARKKCNSRSNSVWNSLLCPNRRARKTYRSTQPNSPRKPARATKLRRRKKNSYEKVQKERKEVSSMRRLRRFNFYAPFL